MRVNRVYIFICVFYELSMIVNLTLQNTLFSLHFIIVYFDFMSINICANFTSGGTAFYTAGLL